VCASWKRVFRPRPRRPLSSSRNCICPPPSCWPPFFPCFPRERLPAVKPFFHYEIVTRRGRGRDVPRPAIAGVSSCAIFAFVLSSNSRRFEVNRGTRTPSPAYHKFTIRYAMSPFNRHECSGGKETWLPDVGKARQRQRILSAIVSLRWRLQLPVGAYRANNYGVNSRMWI